MAARLRLTDREAAKDLDTYLARAQAVQEGGSVRVIASGRALAVYVPVLEPAGLLDDSPTVLGLRVFAIAEQAEPIDMVVPSAQLRTRVTEAMAEGFELGMPTPVYAMTWAGVVPPRGDWQPVGEVSAEVLRAAAVEGIAEVTRTMPTNAGAPVARRVRNQVWRVSLPEDERLTRGVALAAYTLGFLPPSGDELASIHAVGHWTRLTLRRGHVLARHRAWSLAG